MVVLSLRERSWQAFKVRLPVKSEENDFSEIKDLRCNRTESNEHINEDSKELSRPEVIQNSTEI
jgi:hypothetical protein